MTDDGALPARLRERFEVVRLLGQGSFGRVHQVRSRDDGEEFALKRIRLQGDGERERRELAAAVRLRHPRVVRCFDAGVIEGTAYLVLELGESSLEERLADPGAAEECWELLREAMTGLAHLHAEGVIHRDIKPANILVVGGAAKLTDLGLVRDEDLATLTLTGTVMGTPDYLSPEQARGERPTPATDVWSLGVIFYQLLERRLPFPDEGLVEQVTRRARGELEPYRRAVRSVRPATLERLRAMLAPDPAARPGDLDALRQELGSWREAIVEVVEEPTEVLEAARPSGDTRLAGAAATLPAGEVTVPSPRSPRRWWIAAGLAILGMGVFLSAGGRENPPPPALPTVQPVLVIPPTPEPEPPPDPYADLSRRLEAIEVEDVLEAMKAVRERRSPTGDPVPEIVGTWKSWVRRSGLEELLLGQGKNLAEFLGRGEVPFEKRLELFRALERLAPVDFLFLSLNVPTPLGVRTIGRDLLEVSRRSFFSSETGGTIAGIQNDVVKIGGAREVLHPVGVTPDQFAAAIAASRALTGELPRGVPQRSVQLQLPERLPPIVELAIHVENLDPDYYLEVEANGLLTFHIHNPDPARSLSRLEEPPRDPRTLLVSRIVRLPMEALRSGRNLFVLRLHTLGPVHRFPARVRRLGLYYRRVR